MLSWITHGPPPRRARSGGLRWGALSAVGLALFFGTIGVLPRASAQAPAPAPQAWSFPICPGTDRRVPPAVIAAASMDPDSVGGFGELCNPGVPEGPMNGRRSYVGLRAPGLPYHPMFNGLVWRCGCS